MTVIVQIGKEKNTILLERTMILSFYWSLSSLLNNYDNESFKVFIRCLTLDTFLCHLFHLIFPT